MRIDYIINVMIEKIDFANLNVLTSGVRLGKKNSC